MNLKVITGRVNQDESEIIEKAAKLEKRSISSFIRKSTVEVAERVLSKNK